MAWIISLNFEIYYLLNIDGPGVTLSKAIDRGEYTEFFFNLTMTGYVYFEFSGISSGEFFVFPWKGK